MSAVCGLPSLHPHAVVLVVNSLTQGDGRLVGRLLAHARAPRQSFRVVGFDAGQAGDATWQAMDARHVRFVDAGKGDAQAGDENCLHVRFLPNP